MRFAGLEGKEETNNTYTLDKNETRKELKASSRLSALRADLYSTVPVKGEILKTVSHLSCYKSLMPFVLQFQLILEVQHEDLQKTVKTRRKIKLLKGSKLLKKLCLLKLQKCTA